MAHRQPAEKGDEVSSEAAEPVLSLPQSIAKKIEREIIESRWPVGTVYASEVDLVERFGVSRAVLREATKILQQHQVVAPKSGRGGGLVVTAPDHNGVSRSVALLMAYEKVSFSELCETRLVLELDCIRVAAQRLDDEGKARLLQSGQQRPWRTNETPARSATDSDFHVILAELTGNRMLKLFIEVITDLSFQYVTPGDRWSAEAIQGGNRSHAAHIAIAEAIASGNVLLAEKEMQVHIEDLMGLRRDYLSFLP
jgi:DNA-binding FadR family transcriptional regulator